MQKHIFYKKTNKKQTKTKNYKHSGHPMMLRDTIMVLPGFATKMSLFFSLSQLCPQLIMSMSQMSRNNFVFQNMSLKTMSFTKMSLLDIYSSFVIQLSLSQDRCTECSSFVIRHSTFLTFFSTFSQLFFQLFTNFFSTFFNFVYFFFTFCL